MEIKIKFYDIADFLLYWTIKVIAIIDFLRDVDFLDS